jgi:FtsH-binding integral membrane protein
VSYPYVAADQVEVRQRSIISQAYLWMAVGLVITGLVAAFTASSPFMLSLVYGNVLVFWGLLLLEIILVIVLAAAVTRLPVGVALTVFVVYAALNGVTLSGILLAYTKASLASTFFITAGTFAIMAIYGYTTKRDLTRLGNLAFMALIGLILASLVNLFLHNPVVYWITTYLGVLIFVGLIAYDTQKLKRLGSSAEGGSASRLAILGALSLYLDFINLFLFLLRIFGRQND